MCQTGFLACRNPGRAISSIEPWTRTSLVRWPLRRQGTPRQGTNGIPPGATRALRAQAIKRADSAPKLRAFFANPGRRARWWPDRDDQITETARSATDSDRRLAQARSTCWLPRPTNDPLPFTNQIIGQARLIGAELRNASLPASAAPPFRAPTPTQQPPGTARHIHPAAGQQYRDRHRSCQPRAPH